jgi:subtilisin-like proprotein convertase family protein
MRIRFHAFFLIILAMAAAVPALATPPAMMNTQGVLRTQSGLPIADGVHALSFSLYASAADPAALWTENNGAVAIQGGFYSALLGAVTQIPSSLFQNRSELWLGVKVDGGTELPRGRLLTVAYAFEADHALIAAAAESLQCSGCLGEETLGFDLGTKIQDGSRAACYDTLAELRAILDVVYAPLSHTHGGGDITSPVGLCLQAADALGLEGRSLTEVKADILASVDDAGYMKKDDKIDEARLPRNGLDEVSNGLLTTQFQDTAVSMDTPLPIPDFVPPGIASTLDFPNVGTAEDLTVSIDISNSDISGLRVELRDPAGAVHVLYDKGAESGTAIVATYPHPTSVVSGNLLSWIGRNPEGVWRLTVIDLAYKAGGNDGQLNSWTVATRTLSTKRVQVKGDLGVDGNVTVSGTVNGVLLAAEQGKLATAIMPALALAVPVQGNTCPPGYFVLDQYWVGSGSGSFCKARIETAGERCWGCGFPEWVTSDPWCQAEGSPCTCGDPCMVPSTPFVPMWSAVTPSQPEAWSRGAEAGCDPYGHYVAEFARYERQVPQVAWTRCVPVLP